MTRRKDTVDLCLILTLHGLLVAGIYGQTPVRMWEEPTTVPTYEIGPPELNPIFYSGRAYQGAKGPVYPYPLLDKLTDNRVEKTYRTVYLENQYIKISVLPEVGGRIFSGLDKTNNYDFFYRQHVIKPALIGMVGAWISGGVEWNIPHHHRASTFMPVDYKLVENPDGSKTLWVGELELRHRMRWLVGLTMYPGRSYLEATVKLFNRTPLPHSLLYFANVAVHANPDYQVFFPPDTEYGTQHSKVEFIEWPLAHSRYAGIDHDGIDVSWWKNHPAPISIFAWNFTEDFLGGYDHGKQAGVAHVADRHIVPGKKFFEFANGPEGQMWDKILTDSDGPYLELMSGAYSDNQPDYSWAQPYEVKTIKQYWYPLRELGGLKKANLDAAVNLEVGANRTAKFAFNTTSEFPSARILLQVAGRVLYSETIDIGPAKPFHKELPLEPGIQAEDLRVSLVSSDGKELVGYQPEKPKESPMPKPVEPPPAPKDIKTNEELYLAGLRLEQFYNPAREPYPYYEEALKRDPGDSRVNTALGILYCKRGMYSEAETRLNKAIERIARNYTRPKDGEAYYYLGVALKAQGKWSEADEAFHRAGWSYAWYTASHTALAENASRRGDLNIALEYISRAISNNASNTRALNLKTAFLRKLKRYQEAEAMVTQVQSLDPLDFWSVNEQYQILSQMGQKDQAEKVLDDLSKLMREASQSYLELAVDYGNAGMWDDAIAVLIRHASAVKAPQQGNPMVHYFLGYYQQMKGMTEEASRQYSLASQMSPNYCFPFRLEAVEVLQSAMKNNPQDARAPYYLGNLLYDLQPEAAIRAWEKARDLDNQYAVVHRNLAFGYAQVQGDYTKAVSSMEKAVASDSRNPRFFTELDTYYEAAAVPHQKRLAMLEKNHDTVLERDDALLRQIGLHVLTGQYDKAISLMEARHFHLWEGGDEELSNVHNLYVDAHLLRGQERLKAKQSAEALKDFEAALEYPDRFEIGRPYHGGRAPQVHYWIGTAYEALGKKVEARSHYEKALLGRPGLSDLSYYQALAYRKLGQEAKAVKTFDDMIRLGQKDLSSQAPAAFYAKFGGKLSDEGRKARAHFLVGLGYLGKGNPALAKEEFETAHRLDINHLGALTMRASLRE